LGLAFRISAEIPRRRVSQRRVELAGGDEFGAMLLALEEEDDG
jgi:hypothetical protein